MSLFEPLFEALDQGQVRYVVVGGLATVLHGFARLTADVDLVVDLSPPEARKAIGALVQLGLKPRAPVDPFDFADPTIRQAWIRDKGMQVFSLWDPTNPLRSVDLFVELPIPFDELWERSDAISLTSVTVRVASITDLIRLKQIAGRPQDLLDIDALRAIERRRRERRS